ncbi:MAG: glycosyltransferase family 39 protein [Solirubrobacteraceae bacterium]
MLLFGALLVAALGIRIAYVEIEPYHAIDDAGTYNRFASMIALHGDYHTGTKPRSGAGGSRGPTAYFPPAFPYYLAIADLIDGHVHGGPTAVPGERIEMAITGAITVAMIGLVALEAFGTAPAVGSMAVAAVYPVLVEMSGVLMAEDLLVVFELGAVWTALRARRARHPYAWLAATGVLTGLAALTHENAALFVIPLALAAWGIARRRTTRSRASLRALAAPAVVILFTCATISPWTIRNAVELHSFVPVSDEAGITLAGTYNPVSANDPQLRSPACCRPRRWTTSRPIRRLRFRRRSTTRCGCSSWRARTPGRPRRARSGCTTARPGPASSPSGCCAHWRWSGASRSPRGARHAGSGRCRSSTRCRSCSSTSRRRASASRSTCSS